MKKPLLFFKFLLIVFTVFFFSGSAWAFNLVIEGDLSPGSADNKLEAIFIDPAGTRTNVTNDSRTNWTSSNTDMAAIYQNGDVFFSGETGTVVFTATYTLPNATYTATKSHTYDPVESRVYTLILKDELDPKSTSNQLTLYRKYGDDREEKVDNEEVIWESSDKVVATVDREGNVVFTKEAGKVTITARHRGRFASMTATYPTEIKELIINESLTFTEAFFNTPPRLTVSAKINDGTTERIQYPTWKSSNAVVASIDNQGLLKLTGSPGTTVITAEAEGKTATKSLTVPEDKAINLRNIFFTENLFYNSAGQELKVSALYDNNSVKDITKEVTFISSNPDIAQIYGTKLYYSGGSGNLTVTARYENQAATIQGFIYPARSTGKSLTGIRFEKAIYSIADNNTPIIVYGINSDNSSFRITNPILNILQKNIAEIRNGNLLLKGIPGNAIIEASYGRFRDQSNIYNYRPEGGLKANKIYILSNLNSSSKLIPLIAVARYEDGTMKDISESAVWNVNNTAVARISSTGKEVEILSNKDFTLTVYFDGLSATIGSRAYTFPNYTNGINTNLVPINRIYENAKRMLEINQYLPYPNDIRGHWAEPILRKGQMIGWIKGFPDGTLRPNQKVTRGEFAAFADRIFDLTAPTNQTYSDTVNHWASPSISKFKALNIYNMYNTNFRPDDYLTREEMADFIAKLANIRNTNNNPYTDLAENNPYYSSILKATQGGIMVGMDNNRFGPKETATRAQALTVIYNLLKTDVNLSEILN